MYELEFYKDEVTDSIIYEELSKREDDEKMREILEELSRIERNHARFWRKVLERRGVEVKWGPSIWEVRLFLLLRRLLGAALTVKLLETAENSAVYKYLKALEEGDYTEEERRILRRVVEDELEHEALFKEEGSKRGEWFSHVRDMVLGMNDGLVEVLATVAGLAGAYANPLLVALGGLIVASAGTLSMAAGAYVSVKSQGEVIGGGLMRLRLMVEVMRDKLKDRLKGLFKQRGVKDAEAVAEAIAKERRALYSTLAKEEFGREEVEEGPGKAALYTGSFYLIGGMAPVVPFFLAGNITIALAGSLVLASAALGIVGLFTAIVSGISIKRKVLEMVAIGLGVSFITFIIGRLAGMILGVEVA